MRLFVWLPEGEEAKQRNPLNCKTWSNANVAIHGWDHMGCYETPPYLFVDTARPHRGIMIMVMIMLKLHITTSRHVTSPHLTHLFKLYIILFPSRLSYRLASRLLTMWEHHKLCHVGCIPIATKWLWVSSDSKCCFV